MTSISSVNRTIYSGFGLILLLLLLLGAASLYQLGSANQTMTKIVEDNNKKIEFALSMRQAIRLRQDSLNSMLATENIFKRDAERMQFYSHAKLFRESRTKLQQLPANDIEIALLRNIQETTHEAEPLNNIVADLLIEDAPEADINKTMALSRSKQDKLLDLLSQLITTQTQFAREAAIKERQNYNKTTLFVISLGLLGLLLALAIVKRISAHITNNNKLLIQKNNELATVSQQAIDATQKKSTFLATMSREIRTPLTSIIGYAEACLDHKLSRKDRITSTETIVRNGKYLLQIVDDLLDLSKIEANSLNIRLREISPFTLLGDIKALTTSLAEKKELSLFIHYHFPLPKHITSDPLRLKQILLNLCSNALKYTQKGHISIEVSYIHQTKKMKFAVIDTGVGMTPEQTKQILSIFTQTGAQRLPKFQGTGLGLSLCMKLAKQLGGNMEVQSLHGLGSRFSVSVSAGLADDVEFIKDESQITIKNSAVLEQRPSVNLEGQVLLAEDNVDNQRLLSLFISDLGVKVDLAENGEMALEKALTNHYDLVFMDMHMPVLDGIDAIRQLRKTGFTVPIIALSANAMPQDEQDCLNAGCDAFITKPIERKKLQDLTSYYLLEYSKTPQPSQSETATLLAKGTDLAQQLETFSTALQEKVLQCKGALNQNDWQMVNSIAKQLHTTCAENGYPILANVTQQMNTLIKDEKYENLAACINELENMSNSILDGSISSASTTGSTNTRS